MSNEDLDHPGYRRRGRRTPAAGIAGGAFGAAGEIDGHAGHEDRGAMTLAAAGIGLRPEHVRHAMSCPVRDLWLEIDAEDHMLGGGPEAQRLENLRGAGLEISLHCAGLSLASTAGPDPDRLASLKRLVERVQPMLVSEHLAWPRLDGLCPPDLLPVPRTNAVLVRSALNIERVQDLLGRQILIENPTHYMDLKDHSWSEVSFFSELCRRSGCGLLVDVANVAVGAHNTGFVATQWLDSVPAERVGEIHLGGVSLGPEGTLLVDSHDSPVSDQIWDLYRRLTGRIGPRATAIEHDGEMPSFAALLRERGHAQNILDGEIALAA